MTSPVIIPALPARKGRGSRFWLSYLAVVVCSFLSALDVTAVSTALPTITKDLDGGDKFVWVGSAYSLASASIMPSTGKLADIVGRRPIMMTAIGFFFLGSALVGSAQNMDWLIAARTVQGVGGGGIIALSLIILSDLVPLAERGLYQALLILTWAFAAAIGPAVGSSFTQRVTWRWLFYLNLPLAGLAFVLVAFFLRVRTPAGTLKEKLARIDLVGNLMIIAGTTLALVALTWGGIQFSWSSAHVLAPLILGFILLGAFFVYEFHRPNDPTLPLDILANQTSFSGYVSTFFHGILSISIIYYLPVYFQACKAVTPIHSSVSLLASTLIIGPSAFICGVVVKVFNKYRLINYLGWTFLIVGLGFLSLLRVDSSTSQWVGFQIIAAAGVGLLWGGTVFPILAPLPVQRIAAAMGFYSFSRAFAQTWGVTISGSILQNQLKRRLPHEFVVQFPQGLEIAYAAIPIIPTLPEPLRTQVREAFADSLSVVWKAMIGFSAAGFATLFLLKEVPMHKHTDDTYGLKEDSEGDTTLPPEIHSSSYGTGSQSVAGDVKMVAMSQDTSELSAKTTSLA